MTDTHGVTTEASIQRRIQTRSRSLMTQIQGHQDDGRGRARHRTAAAVPIGLGTVCGGRRR